MTLAASARSAEEKRELLAELLLGRHRRLFPTLAHKTYLNYGAQGLLPAPALAAMQRFYEELSAAGPMSIEGSLLVLDELRRTRAALAAELRAAPERLALVDNTSMGCNTVLWGLDWQSGDQILLGDHEYPGVAAAVDELARRRGLAVAPLPTDAPPDRLLAELAARLTPATRLLVVSHVAWDTGRVLPLAEVVARCRERGVRVLVDGAQAVGAMPVDLTALGADFYAFPGHKWCCGPEGTGGLYVDARAAADLHPTLIGPRSLRHDLPDGGRDFHPDARRFETSSSAVALCAGLRAALELHEAWGDREARWRRIRKLAEQLWSRLGELEPDLVERLQTEPPETGLVFFRLRGERGERGQEPERLVRFLEAGGILARSMPQRRCLRISIHYLTLERDLDRLLEEVRRFAAPSAG